LCVEQIQRILFLAQCHSPWITSHLNSKEEVKGAEILNRKSFAKGSNKTIRGTWRRAGKHNIIDVDDKVHGEAGLTEHKHRSVSLCSLKAQLVQLVAQARVPSPRGLLKSIDGFLQLADILGVALIFKARGLRCFF
jgi:hypothetical protein